MLDLFLLQSAVVRGTSGFSAVWSRRQAQTESLTVAYDEGIHDFVVL